RMGCCPRPRCHAGLAPHRDSALAQLLPATLELTLFIASAATLQRSAHCPQDLVKLPAGFEVFTASDPTAPRNPYVSGVYSGRNNRWIRYFYSTNVLNRLFLYPLVKCPGANSYCRHIFHS